jgi:methylmalonyl-CoA mutase
VNTFLEGEESHTVVPGEVIRATNEEKEYQIKMLDQLHKTWKNETQEQLKLMQHAAVSNKNIFESLMEATKFASIGQITNALFDVGGQYRRNM